MSKESERDCLWLCYDSSVMKWEAMVVANFVYATDLSVRSSGLNFGFLGNYDFFAGSATELRFFDDANNFASLSGSGFVFQTFFGQLIDVSAGTINALSASSAGNPVVTVTDWALDAAAVFGLIVSNDDVGLRRLLTGGDDTFSLSNLRDVFNGGTGNDVIQGLNGHDALSGGNGADTLFGGIGNDVLDGNKGRDHFVFDTALNATTNVDTIIAFDVVRDKIVLESSVFVGTGAEGGFLSAQRFALDAAADRNDVIVYVAATGEILYDADGFGAGTAVLFARVDAGTLLEANDFLIG